MAQHALYVMISRTDTTVGKIIRYFTDYDYNHVSLSLDPTFGRWVSFARYALDVPLAGGFIEENADRFFTADGPMPVRIFRVNISENRFRILEKLFTRAGDPECGLIYNTFGALASGLRIPFPVASAYTCLEFANAVLEQSHETIQDLNGWLEPHLIYDGDLRRLIAPTGCRDSSYFQPRSLTAAAGETAMHFMRLLRYTVSPRRYDAVAAGLRLP